MLFDHMNKYPRPYVVLNIGLMMIIVQATFLATDSFVVVVVSYSLMAVGKTTTT